MGAQYAWEGGETSRSERGCGWGYDHAGSIRHAVPLTVPSVMTCAELSA